MVEMCLCSCEFSACIFSFVCIFEPLGWSWQLSVGPHRLSKDEQRNTLCNMWGRKIKWCRSNSLVLHKLQMNVTLNININSVDFQMRSRICCLIKGPDGLLSIRWCLFTLMFTFMWITASFLVNISDYRSGPHTSGEKRSELSDVCICMIDFLSFSFCHLFFLEMF